jgi:hypothetical protein
MQSGQYELYLFFNIGVNLGNKSLIGGCILFIPITFTMAYNVVQMCVITQSVKVTYMYFYTIIFIDPIHNAC